MDASAAKAEQIPMAASRLGGFTARSLDQPQGASPGTVGKNRG
jgi:hypothetical protein